MTVSVHKGQLDYFRRKCRRTPNEIMAVLIGTYDGRSKTAHVERFLYPALEVSTPSILCVSKEETNRIIDLAYEQGLQPLGSIHNHIDWPPVLSGVDYKFFKDYGDLFVGICEVQKQTCTRVFFWVGDSSLPCKLVYKL